MRRADSEGFCWESQKKKKAWQNASANIINFQASSDLFGIKKEEEEEEEEEEDTKYNTTDLCGIPPEHWEQLSHLSWTIDVE